MEAVLPNHPATLLLSSLFKAFKGCLLDWPHHNRIATHNWHIQLGQSLLLAAELGYSQPGGIYSILVFMYISERGHWGLFVVKMNHNEIFRLLPAKV